MNNNGGKDSVGNPVEGTAERVDGDENEDTGEPTSQGSAHTRLGLDGGTRERTGSSVGTEARADKVGDTDGDELLVGVDLVVVETTERLCNGNVLEKKHNHRDRQLRGKVGEEGGVQNGLTNVFEATGNGEEDADGVLFRVLVMAQPNAPITCLQD